MSATSSRQRGAQRPEYSAAIISWVCNYKDWNLASVGFWLDRWVVTTQRSDQASGACSLLQNGRGLGSPRAHVNGCLREENS